MSNPIERSVYRGRGIEADKLGSPYDVYRNNELIIPRLPVLVRRTTKRDNILAAVSLRDVVFVELVCDCTNLLPGDVLRGVSPDDRYVLSTKDFNKPTIGYRCESPVTMRRPTQGASDPQNVRPYGGRKASTDQILVYNASTNLYSFASSGVAATIYAAKSRIGYSGSNPSFKLPEDVRLSRWTFILELLPGVKIEENDYITLDGDDYMVVSVDKQVAGFYGQAIFCDLVRA